jgi:dTDP-4-amino-4,6-dideoxygalactose transaminase
MGKLAIKGGKALLTGHSKAPWPIVDKKDVDRVAAVAKSGGWWRHSGHEVETFEKAYAKFHKAKYALAVNNGTVSIETSLKAMGLEPGDEVIVPAVTFIASASGVLMARGVPIFADINPDTYQIDPKSIEQQISPRTKGIVVVHYGGYPADMDAINKIARKHKLFVFEDCAHAQGSEWRGKGVGAVGDMGSFSFQQSKALTSGEGGIIITDNQKYWEVAYAYHTIGRTLGSKMYAHVMVGPNYRMTEFQGAILNTQLDKYKKQIYLKMKNAAYFSKELRKIGLEPLPEDSRITRRGYYYYIFKYNQNLFQGVHRDVFRDACQAEGAGIGRGYGRPVYAYPVFQDNYFDIYGTPVKNKRHIKTRVVDYSKVCLPVAEHASYEEHCCIGHSNLLYRDSLDKILAVIHKVVKNIDELKGMKPKKD